MIIAASLKRLLETHKLSFMILPHKRVTSLDLAAKLLNIDPKNVLCAQVLADGGSQVLVVHQLNRKINFASINKLLDHNLKVLPDMEVNRIFNDCESNCWPAIGQPYKIEVILDKNIKQLDHVYFASGSHTALLQMQISDFLILHSRAKFLAISLERELILETEVANNLDLEATAALDNLTFPELPPIAMQILQLAMHKDHSTKELVDLVSQDITIQQQILFYSQLPFIREKLQLVSQAQPTEDVHAIVEHILGFDMVSHIALGVAAGRACDAQRPGNLQDFWRHALYAATYAQRITELVASNLQLNPAISYLAGLFHNFGLLLFSQLFPPEYTLLKKWMHLNPRLSIAVLEKRLLGMGQALNIVRGGHAQLGEWLLRSWHMPESICVIAREHHSLVYDGKYSEYVKIIQLTNQLLYADGIGDGNATGISKQLLDPLGLSPEQLYNGVSELKAGAAALDSMARSLTNLY